MHLEGVVGDGGREVGCTVAMETVALRQLGLLVLTIWLNEGTHMPEWLVNLISDSIKKREVPSLRGRQKTPAYILWYNTLSTELDSRALRLHEFPQHV